MAYSSHHSKRHLDRFSRFLMSPECYTVQCIVTGETPKLPLLLWIVILSPCRRRPSHSHRQHAQKLVKIAPVVPEISSPTDRQTDTHTDILITILRHGSRRRSKHHSTKASLLYSHDSVSMALSSTGLSPTCHLASSASDVITLSRPCIRLPVVFPKAPFLVLCFSSCTLPPQYSHLLSLPEPPPLCSDDTIVFLVLPPSTSTQELPTYKMPFRKSLRG